MSWISRGEFFAVVSNVDYGKGKGGWCLPTKHVPIVEELAFEILQAMQ